MTEETVNKFATLLAKCATTGDAAELRKEAAAHALVKSAIAADQLLIPATVAAGGGLVGYLGTKDEKKKLRNALTGALLGGGGSAAMQFAYNQLNPGSESADKETPGGLGDLSRLTGGLIGGGAGYRAAARFAPTDKNIGEVARAAKPARSWWGGKVKTGPADNKTLQQMFADLIAARRMPGVTSNAAAASNFASSLGGSKPMDVGTKRILTAILDAGRISSDPTERAKAMDVLSSVASRGRAGGKAPAPVSPQAVNEFFNARQRGLTRFGKPVAGGLIGSLGGTAIADALLSYLQGQSGGANEAK